MSESPAHESPFGLVRKEDPQTKIILGARMDVLTDADLTDGAKNLFNLLLDLSLNPDVNQRRRGQILISTTQLCERLHRSKRSIWSWKKELTEKRFIWISKFLRPNMHAMHRFHIAALDPVQQGREEVPGDGLWGNGYRRPDQPTMPLGARAQSGKKRHLLVDRLGNPLFSNSAINEPPTRKERHFSPANFAGGNGKKYTSHPQNLREHDAQNITSAPQNLRTAGVHFAGENGTKEHSFNKSLVGDLVPFSKGGDHPAPVEDREAAFKLWEKRLDDMRNSDLRKLDEIVTREHQDARSADAKALARHKLVAIRLRLRGPSVPDEKPTKSKPTRKAPAQEKPMTEEVLLESARNAVALGATFLTEGQRQALKRVGEL
jgi:hypothetical protein